MFRGKTPFAILLLWLGLNSAFALPTISSFSPASGGPGTQVTILGSQLGGIVEVVFGNAKANILQRGANGLVVVVPLDAVSASIYVYDQSRNFDYTVVPFHVMPRVTGFTPVRGVVGEEVVISGFNFSNINNLGLPPLVYFGNVPALAFLGADTQITAYVPAGALTGPITVETLAGYQTSSALFYLPPVIESFTPSRAKVGEVLTIKGVNFTGATVARIGGAAATILNAQLKEMTVQVPTGALDGTLYVETPGGAFFSDSGSPFLLLPKIDGFTPAGGDVGTVVTLQGTGLKNATKVTLGDKVATISSTSPLETKFTVPSGTISSPITVVTPSGTNQSAGVFYVTPNISLINPIRGQTGTVVTVTGLNMLGASKVEFGGISTPEFTVVDNTKLTARVPYGAINGTVRVTNPGGAATSGQAFEVIGDEPVITSFDPPYGLPGTSITLTGFNFQDATNVTFNGIGSIPTVQSSTSIKVNVPDGATTGPLKVFTPKGSGTASTEFLVGDSAELKLTASVIPDPPIVGGRLVYSVDVRNSGPLDATSVVINFALPKEADYVDATVSRGTFERLGTGIINTVGKLSAGASTTLLVMVVPKAEGTVTAAAQVSSDLPDYNADDNAAKIVLQAAPLRLKLDAIANGFVRLSWPDAVTNYVVESAPILAPGQWTTLTNTPLNIEDEYRVAVPFVPGEHRFYRLRK